MTFRAITFAQRHRWTVMVVALFIVVSTAMGLYVGNRPSREMATRVNRTTNQQRDGWVQFFRRGESSLSIDETGAHFKLAQNGRRLCLGDPEDPKSVQHMEFVTQFTLTKPDEKFWSPDHHGSAIFTVKRITPEGVVLSYSTSFDGRSFGEDLFSIDVGEITLEPFQSRFGQDIQK
jgi:hypothetical protein